MAERNASKWPKGWCDPRDLERRFLERRLREEVGPTHILSNQPARAIALRRDSDEALYELPDGQVAQVQIIWTVHPPEHDPRWPATTIFTSLDKWRRFWISEVYATLHPDFVDSFTDLAEMTSWTREYLSTLRPGGRISRELYESVIFPVLLSGYERKDLWSICWLGYTCKNLNSAEHLYRRINFVDPCDLFKEAYSLDPHWDLVREGLLPELIGRFQIMGHEWPTAILYDPNKSWPVAYSEACQEIRLARELDATGRYAREIAEFEEKITADFARRKRGENSDH